MAPEIESSEGIQIKEASRGMLNLKIACGDRNPKGYGIEVLVQL
jgi:hypothetical protein